MIRKDVFKKVGFYREQYLWCEDIDLWYRIIFSGFEVANTPQYLLKYRVTDSSVRFKLKPSLKEYFFMYLHLLLGFTLTGKQKTRLESWYKKLFYGK